MRRGVPLLVASLTVAAACAEGGGSGLVAARDPGPTTATRPGTTATGPTAATSDPTRTTGTGWAAIDATLAAAFDPGSDNPCNRGAVPDCIDAVLAEMTARRTPLAGECDHNAPFALTYEVTTRVIGEQVAQGEVFADGAFLAHFDAWFAKKYFDARDRWLAGDEDGVPTAWRVAFAASDERAVNAVGDVLLGMNAHISRDLAFTVAETIPVEDPVRRADYRRVNDVLGKAQPQVLAELGAVEPTIGTLEVPAVLGAPSFVALVTTWRDEAYLRGRRLADATTDDERNRARQAIEDASAQRALAIRVATTNLPLLGDRTGRDARCDG